MVSITYGVSNACKVGLQVEMTLSMITLNIKTLGIMTLSIMTFSIMIISIIAFSGAASLGQNAFRSTRC
jgi:hypothetical protein